MVTPMLHLKDQQTPLLPLHINLIKAATMATVSAMAMDLVVERNKQTFSFCILYFEISHRSDFN